MKILNVMALSSICLVMPVGSHLLADVPECTCEKSTDGSDTVIDITSTNGTSMTMRFAANPVTRQTKLAFLCAGDENTAENKVTEAKLWMPAHGHGSSPTTLVAVSKTCTRVEKVSFIMLGDWEIRTTFANGDKGVFPVEVVVPNE